MLTLALKNNIKMDVSVVATTFFTLKMSINGVQDYMNKIKNYKYDDRDNECSKNSEREIIVYARL